MQAVGGFGADITRSQFTRLAIALCLGTLVECECKILWVLLYSCTLFEQCSGRNRKCTHTAFYMQLSKQGPDVSLLLVAGS